MSLDFDLNTSYPDQYGIIRTSDGHKILVDFQDFLTIINSQTNFLGNSYKDYFSRIFDKQDTSSIYCKFLDDNPDNFRKSNVQIYHHYHPNIDSQWDIIDYNLGHIKTKGKDAYIYKNPTWTVKSTNPNRDTEILMFCESDILVKLCPVSLQKIHDFEKTHNNGEKITFFIHPQSGYICSSLNLYIHQIITGCHGNGKGTKKVSVDHIDGDPLNNTWDNLRVANLHQQLQNSKGVKSGTKRARKHNAQNLPEGWTQEMLPKYVTYNRECYNKAKNLWREFFRIEKHPNQKKQWSSSKSTQKSLESKLSQTVEALEVLSQGIQPKSLSQKSVFPTYITLKDYRGTPHLVYDRKLPDKTRHNLRMKTNPPLKEDSTPSQKTQQLELFKTKIYQKYKVKIV